MTQLRASGGYRWIRCPASPRLSAYRADEPSDAAREGTCAAWVAERVINGDASSVQDMLNETHPNGWVADEEMIFHVGKYVDVVRSHGGRPRAEVGVSLWNGLVIGMCDASTLVYLTAWDMTCLHIDDLKYGHDIVEDYTQVKIYAAGHLHLAWDYCQLGYYQPRSAHPEGVYRTRTFSRAEIEAFATELYAAAIETTKPDALATPSPAACVNCPAASTCHALGAVVYHLVDTFRDRRRYDLTADQLAVELEFVEQATDLINARATAIRGEAEARVSHGEFVPGWAMKSGHGQRKWKYSVDVIELMTGKTLHKREPISPRQAELAGLDVSKLTVQPTTKPKLARITEDDFARAFKGIKR